MENLTDYKPLERVLLPGLGELECTGLVLIVGPNSSGKTLLLKDLHRYVSGDTRTLIVAEEIVLGVPEFDPFLESLIEARYLSLHKDDKGREMIWPLTTIAGGSESAGQTTVDNVRAWHTAMKDHDASQGPIPANFMHYFRFALVTALFLQNRLELMNEVDAVDFKTQHPLNGLHDLYMNERARDEIAQETARVFSQAVWPDATRGTKICLRVSDSPDLPSDREMRSAQSMSAFQAIETEGDGFKSYVATCVSLLLGLRPVCLIDEPGLCLHPPQAYSLGQFIGKFGLSEKTVTFVATHSSQILRGVIESQILRGVIETGKRLQIVRLTRNGSNFQAHHVPSELLADILIRPTARAETVLDGIFSQAVAVVEAESDRTVYQAAWETVNPEIPIDIHYVAVGGTGGFADTCRLYSALQIPVTAIADLDIIADADKFKKVLSALTDAAITETLVRRAATIAGVIKDTPPNVEADAIRTELQTMLERPLEWSQGHDSQLKKKLARLAGALDRKRPLKKGVNSVPEEVREDLSSLIDACKQHGLFLVPVGELEEWLSGYDVRASKQNKWAWANAAASCIRNQGRQKGDIWDFISEVGNYLKSALETESPVSATLSQTGDTDSLGSQLKAAKGLGPVQ